MRVFTGLVRDIGKVEAVETAADGVTLRIATELGAEVAGMPFGMPRRPAPEPLSQFVHVRHYNRRVVFDG